MARTPSRNYSHATRRLSDDHDDGVAATWHRADAIFPKLKFRKLQKQTLSQHREEVDGLLRLAGLREGSSRILIFALVGLELGSKDGR